MSTDREEMLSVAEVCELPPGDAQNATWVNPGFNAVVRKIVSTSVKKTGKPMHICTLADTTGSAVISMTVFTAPKFSEGDLIEVSGQGLRRTEFNGLAQVSIGQKTEIHRIGKSVHHEEQVQRAAAGAPAIDGTLQPVEGQTVGMAMKEAISLVLESHAGIDLNDPTFWADVHTCASDIIRVSRLLVKGKLAPPVRERNGEKPKDPEPPPPPPAEVKTAARAKPTEAQLANLTDGSGDDSIPF